MTEFFDGMLVMACLLAGLFFLRFWRDTRDRLFAWFSIAFWLLAANWLMLAVSHRDEIQNAVYLVRLCAFVLILIGIADKNRGLKAKQPQSLTK